MDVNQIRDTMSALIVQIARAHRQQAENGLNEIGLHAGQEWLMCLLQEKDGLTQSELAELLDVQPPTVSKMLDRLKQKGLILRQADAEDARISRVYLTEEGRLLHEPIAQVWQNLEEKTIKGLSPMEQVLLRRLLMQVLENLQ